ncbi:ribonucleotide-diphosphate reductase subunit alpha, partial [Cycloclasticus sp. 44_32_T64]
MSLAATSPATEHSTTMVIRRNGKATQFDSNKIYIAISKAFLAVEGEHSQQSSHIHDIATQLTKQIQQATFRNLSVNDTIHIEQIQDQVELALMRADHHKVARAYVLYREKRSNERSEQEQDQQASSAIQIKATDGSLSPYNKQQLVALLEECAAGLEDISSSTVLEAIQKNLFDEIPQHAFEQAIVMGARGLIDQQPDYSRLAARLLLNNARTEALNFTQQ